MLQSAINGVGEGALRRRALDQQHQAEMSRLALESQLRDVQEKRYDAQSAHFGEMEKIATDRNQGLSDAQITKAKQLAIKTFSDHKKSVESSVRQGLMDADVAADALRTTGEQINTQTGGLLDESPDYAEVSNPDYTLKNPPSFDPKDAMIQRDKYATALETQATAAKDNPTLATQLQDRAAKIRQSIAKTPEVKPIGSKETVLFGDEKDAAGNPVKIGTTRQNIYPPAPTAAIPAPADAVPAPASSAPATPFSSLLNPQEDAPQPSSIPLPPANTNGVPTAKTPKPQHVAYLVAHPETAAAFDQKFGQGSAALVLKQASTQPGIPPTQ